MIEIATKEEQLTYIDISNPFGSKESIQAEDLIFCYGTFQPWTYNVFIQWSDLAVESINGSVGTKEDYAVDFGPFKGLWPSMIDRLDNGEVEVEFMYDCCVWE